MPPFGQNIPEPLPKPEPQSGSNEARRNPYPGKDLSKDTFFSQLIRGPKMPDKKESSEEYRGIFNNGKVSRKVFEKAVKKYDPSVNLNSEKRADLAKEIPTKYHETVLEKDIEKHLKNLKTERSSANTNRRIDIGQTKKLLDKLMGKE